MEEEVKTPEVDKKTQPIAFAQKTRADRIREASSAPDFSIPEIRPVDSFFSESSMQMDDDTLKDIMRQTGVYASTGKQVSTAIENALIGMNQLGDEVKIAYGNLANYFTGSSVGDEMAKIAYESITQRYNEMANSEEAIGGIRSNLAQLAGGATSFVQLALEGIATAGVLPLAHIGVQEFGQGTYNDMKAYAEEHEGSLKGYEPEGFDLAANTANSLLQIGIESTLGVGSPRFLLGASRGLWKEGLSGALQEGVQGALSDLTEAVKGNEDISILLDNAEDYLRDAIIGGVLQGALGAVTHHQNYARATNNTAEAIAMARGHSTPTAEDKEQAKAIIDAKEREEASILTQEFKAAFDASTGEGQLQKKIATELKRAVENKELDLDTTNETELAQRIEQIATQETLNAMDFAKEQNRAISDMELNNIVYKDGAIWLEGLTPELGDKAVSYARVLAERQSGLAEARNQLDAINEEIKQTKADLVQAQQEKQESRVKVLQARIAKQNALAEKNRIRTEKLEAQTAKLEQQIAKAIPDIAKATAKTSDIVSDKIADMKGSSLKELASLKLTKTPVAERKSLKQERIAKKQAKTAPSIDDDGLLHQAKPVKEATTQIQQQFDLADENARLDDIYPAYDGETIEIDGKERIVYNSNGDRIAKSKEALTNFWRWFGDSKVVDSQGRPLVVYHGSDVSGIEVFDNQANQTKQRQIGAEKGYFFTDSKKVAERFRTTEQRKAESKYYAENTIIEPVTEEKYDAQGRYLGSVHYTKTTLPESKNFGLYSVYLKAESVNEYSGEDIGVGEERATALESAKQSGKDGVIIYKADTGAGIANEYIVFDSTQIKSVDNRGTFSSDTGNILQQGTISGKGDTARGGYDEQLKRIILGEKSDRSTIQRECAHYWMQNNFKWARSGLASQDWLRRWRDVEEWLGIEPQDRLLSKSASEKFAKAYERYILEGKVTPELQWAFEGFQKAYQDIYSDLENEYFDLSEELAPEVIDWFNRNKEQSPKRLLEADTKKIEKQIALSAGASVIEDVNGNVVMTEQNKEGDPVVYMGVKESEIPAGDNLLVQADKTTASKLQQSAKRWLSDKVEVQQLTTLDTQATLNNFKNWIARDRAGAWDAMMNPDTRPIYRTYLYKAFAQEAMNDADLAVELANIDMGQAVREMGQAIQALDIRNESGFDTLEIMRNIEKSKGKMSTEELNKEVESMGLDMIELSQADIDEIEFDTECKL